MSTLTKILIVLVTLSAIFLCGIVVTYVANAENYRQKYNDLRSEKDALKESQEALKKQLREKNTEAEQQYRQLKETIASLESKAKQSEIKFNNAEREKAALLQKVNNWTSITRDFYETNEKQGDLLNSKLAELKEVQAKQIKQEKRLEETSASLLEKMAIIDTIKAEKRRLIEQKSELEERLNQLLQPGGQAAAAVTPVTRLPGRAEPRTAGVAVADQIDLKAMVKEVDLKNSLATISIGKADGVREGMVFHVTRADEFICDVLIIEVDIEKAVGILDMVQQQPRTGDNAVTNF